MKINVNTPEGQSEIDIPDNWLALESTQAKILDVLKRAYPEAAKEQAKQLEELVKLTAKQNDRQEKNEKEAEKDREKQEKILNEIASNSGSGGSGKQSTIDPDAVARYNKAAAMGEQVFTKAYTAVSRFALTATAVVTALGGAFYKGLTSVGEELNDLTAAGVGFTDSLDQGGMSATKSLAALSAQGVDAAGVMASYSNVVASMGKSTFVDFTNSLMDATDSGVELGMSLDKAIERYGNELSVRQQLGALNTATRAGQIQQNKEIQTTVKRQQMYSTALGISTDSLAEFSANLVTSAPVLTSTLLRFSSDVRGSVTSALQDFGTAMMGMGGQSGADIATAMVDAASSGAMGFSEEMTGFVRAVPSLAGPMNNFIAQVQAGTLSQEEANEMAQEMAMNLGNLSQSEKSRIFALARAGDAQAQSMAKAVTQFEQSSKKIEKMNGDFTMDEVQKGTNMFNKILKELMGTFDVLKYSFFAGVGQTSDLSEALGKAKDTVLKAFAGVLKSFGGAGDIFDDVSGSAESIGKSFGEKLPIIIGKVAEGLAGFISAIPGIVDGLMSFGSAVVSVVKVLGFIAKLAVPIIAAVAAFKLFSATLAAFGGGSLTDKLFGGIKNKFKEKFGGKVDELDGAGKAADTASKSTKRLTQTIGKGMSDISKGVKDLLKNVGDGIGKFIKSVSKGIGSAVETLAGALGKGLSAIGKGIGGFLKGMSSGLTALANPAALIGLGAIVIAINGIALALRIAAPGIEAFGKMMKSVLEGIAPVIESFGKAVATVFAGLGIIIESYGKAFAVILAGIGIAVESVGKAIATVFAGIGIVIESVGKSMRDVLNGLSAVFRSFGKVAESVGKSIKSVLEGVSTVLDSFGGVVERVGGAISNVFDSIGSVITSFGNAVRGVLTGIGDMMATTFDALGRLDGVQLLSAAAGITAVGASLVALGSGKMIEGITSFVGALFGGGKDPVQQLIELGKVAPGINDLGDTMAEFGDLVDSFNEASANIDAELFASKMAIMSNSLSEFTKQVDGLDMGTLLQLAAMGIFGKETTVPETTDGPLPVEIVGGNVPQAQPEQLQEIVPTGVRKAETELLQEIKPTGVRKEQVDFEKPKTFAEKFDNLYAEAVGRVEAKQAEMDARLSEKFAQLEPKPEQPELTPIEVNVKPLELPEKKPIAKPVKVKDSDICCCPPEDSVKQSIKKEEDKGLIKTAAKSETVQREGTFVESKFAEQDPENYKKFKAREQELYKEKFDEEIGKGKSRRQARLSAGATRMEAIKEFAPQAEAVGAAQFRDKQTGQPITAKEFAKGPELPTRESAQQAAQTPAETMAPQTGDSAQGKEKNTAEEQIDILKALLEATQQQNRLLRQQNQTSTKIADQI